MYVFQCLLEDVFRGYDITFIFAMYLSDRRLKNVSLNRLSRELWF